MPTIGIDHIAMPTANADRLLQRPGFPINNEDAWRLARCRRFRFRQEKRKINASRGGTPLPYGVRLCKRWVAPISALSFKAP